MRSLGRDTLVSVWTSTSTSRALAARIHAAHYGHLALELRHIVLAGLGLEHRPSCSKARTQQLFQERHPGTQTRISARLHEGFHMPQHIDQPLPGLLPDISLV